MQIIDLKEKKFSAEVDLLEKELCNLIFHNWATIFPDIELIEKEFVLTGEVRDKQTGGRIDFFGYNRTDRRFVIIEVKKVYDKNIRSQIFDYADAVEDNFSFILLKSKQIIPDIKIFKKSLELILFAKYFKTNDYERIKKIDYPTKLVTYRVFKNYQILLDYVDNNKQIKINSVKKIGSTKPEEKNENELEILDFWHTFFDLMNRQIILQNEDYRLEGPELMLRLSSTHRKYVNEQLKNGLTYLPANYLRKQFSRSNAYIRFVKSVRFKDVISSAYFFDYSKIKSLVDQ